MKEAVEEAFAAGLVKVVFATETLSLGINMPARSVVIEKLSKFTGEHHEFLTPGEYTQLTGRAGRRGIDDVGYAIVCWSPFVPFDQVAGLASRRTYALTSSFRPTYNMAANLVARYPAEMAHHLLNLSFAQYRADRDVVALERQLERNRELLERQQAAPRCERGDVAEYRELLAARDAGPAGAAAVAARSPTPSMRCARATCSAVRRGGGRAVVLKHEGSRGGARVLALGSSRDVFRLGPPTSTARPARSGPSRCPGRSRPAAPRSAGTWSAAMRAPCGPTTGAAAPGRRGAGRGPRARDRRPPGGVVPGAVDPPEGRRRRRAPGAGRRPARAPGPGPQREPGPPVRPGAAGHRVLGLRRRVGAHAGRPPPRPALLRVRPAARRVAAHRPARRARRARARRARSAASPTSTGAPRTGALPPVRWPSSRVAKRSREIERLWRDLSANEDDAGLPETRAPIPGLVAAMYAWADGDTLTDVLDEDEDLTGGDFVRHVKQVIDLLHQVGDVAPEPETAGPARRAADACFRGVVAASSLLRPDEARPASPRLCVSGVAPIRDKRRRDRGVT